MFRKFALAAAIISACSISTAVNAASIVLTINVPMLATGSTNNEFSFADQNNNGVYQSIIYYSLSSGRNQVNGPTFDRTVDNDFILNYNFSVASDGVLSKNPTYSFYVDPAFSTSSFSIMNGNTVVGAVTPTSTVSVQAGIQYTLVANLHSRANGFTPLQNGYNQGVVIVPLDLNRASTSAVPELATWMMLIAGFGLVGCAMRRRATVSYT